MYMLQILGMDKEQPCFDDIVHMASSNVKNVPVSQACSIDFDPFSELTSLDRDLTEILKEEPKLRSDLAGMDEESNKSQMIQSIRGDPSSFAYVDSIEEQEKQYNAMTAEDQKKNQEKIKAFVDQQVQALSVRPEVTAYAQTQWHYLAEALFYSKATPAQRQEYLTRKKCLEEPLF
jgi:hypothetical protein